MGRQVQCVRIKGSKVCTKSFTTFGRTIILMLYKHGHVVVYFK